MLRTLLRSTGISIVMAAVGACGGGGGSGNGGGGGANFSLSTNSISFDKDVTSFASDAAVIKGQLNDPGQEVYIFVDASQTPLIAEAEVFISGNSGELFLWPANPGDLGGGTHTGTVTVRACRDSTCSSEYSGSPQAIQVTYSVVAPDFDVETSEVNFTSIGGTESLPEPQTVGLTTSAGYVSSFGHSYPSRADEWVSVGVDWSGAEGTATFTVLNGLPVGSYSADFTLFIFGEAIARTITVNYVVEPNPFSVLPETVQFEVDSESSPASVEHTLTIQNPRDESINWNASVDVPWLELSAETGDTVTNNTLELRLTSAVANLSPGSHSAALTLVDPHNENNGLVVDISLSLQAPTVAAVGPGIGFTNEAATVTVWGSGFHTGVSSITVGDQEVPVTDVVSDRELKFSTPLLGEGSYPVYIPNSSGLMLSESRLEIVSSTPYLADFVASASAIRNPVYDAVRKAVYASDEFGNINKFAYVDSAWRLAASQPTPFGGHISKLAMTPDGRLLGVVSQTEDGLAFLDLDTFTVLSNTAPGLWRPMDIAFYTNTKALALTEAGVFHYDLAQGATEAEEFGDLRYLTGRSKALVTLDLSKVYISTEYDKARIFDTRSMTLSSSQVQPGQEFASISRSGDRISFDSGVYDADLVELGNLVGWATAISPDGRYAYAYNSFNGDSKVAVYDLTTTDDNGIFIATGEAIAIDEDHSYVTGTAITPDGSALFLTSDAGLFIRPLP
jgi:hypothetical protein